MAIVTVTGTSDSQYETRITNGRHTMTADEPVPLGTDLGPNPYEFLLSALGACTSITLFMYAGRKNWPLERVRIELTHDRVHADDCEQCEEESGLVDLIERKIALPGLESGSFDAGIMRVIGPNAEFPGGSHATIGLRMVKAYLENNPGSTASSLIKVSAEEIYEGSSYNP